MTKKEIDALLEEIRTLADEVERQQRSKDDV